MSKFIITFILVFGWIIYLKPEARVTPFLDGTIETEGIVNFAPNYVGFKYNGKDIKIPYCSIAFIINDQNETAIENIKNDMLGVSP